jgi:hypothetical protein
MIGLGIAAYKSTGESMKRALIALAMFAFASAGPIRAQESAGPDTLVWCGLDYSMVKMIGATDFAQPQQIFPGMLVAWNGLFMKEMLPELEKMAKSVRTDLTAVAANNEKASEKQIQREDGSREEMVTPTHIKDSDIAELVRSYKLKNTQGLGLVFIADRLVKAQETGCFYVVFFDISSRKVISSNRLCEKAGGMGFRNYWFRPVKDAVKKLPKLYREAKATK